MTNQLTPSHGLDASPDETCEGAEKKSGSAALDAAITECMLADQPGLERRLARISGTQRATASARRARKRLRKAIADSAAKRRRRFEALPSPAVAESLPIHACHERIAHVVSSSQITIVCGETGSGKTTQLPKICLQIGRGVAGLIGHTQPRRLAARGVAQRIAEELDPSAARTVGYKVRFDAEVGPACYVKLMTDGILLAEIQSDPMLLAYDTIILDEAHERSLNLDFLMGYLKTLLPRRPELKLIVSSATIDTKRFSDYFDGAPIIEVGGRSYPVEVRYQPPESSDGESEDRVDLAVSAILNLWHTEDGDILAFFPGERDIHEAQKKLRGKQLGGAEILPLYARLPLAAQRRVLTPGTARRVILSTNVAETSVTVPRVRCVVDTGLARVSRYNRHAGVARLPVEQISRASAEQRKGRCGRVGPGVCVRLYAQAEFEQRAEFGEPEILRSNLAAVLLRMRALNIKELADFPFIDSPDRRHVNDGLRLLGELRALGDDGSLTRIGRRLARLPLEPRLGRMLLAAEHYDCVADILVIAAALSVADPRLRPAGRETAADAAHRRYADERSDFLTLSNLWNLYHERVRGLPGDALHAFCRKRFLSLSRMREWQEVHDQLKQIAAELGIRRGRRGAPYTRIHKALLTGLLRNVGYLNAEREYTGVRGATFRVSPGSAQHAAKSKWIMAAELVETTRLYAFTAARIRPEWIEHAAGALIRKSYFDAHWDRRRGQCMVFEQAALYGLTVIPGRRRRYAPISPSEARRIFIRSALVDGQLDVATHFLHHNREVVDRLRSYEDRLRQPDALISDAWLFEFYDHRVPSQVFDAQTFEHWVRTLDSSEVDDLCLDFDALVEGKLGEDMAKRFPDSIQIGEHSLGARYQFEPGASDDGVSVSIPLTLLSDIDHRPFTWLVPGYLEVKVDALLRGLPKSRRREIVPLTEVTESFLAQDPLRKDSLQSALSEHVKRTRGVEIAPEEWREQRLPSHLLMNFEVVGGDGQMLGSSRDLPELQRRFGGRARTTAEPGALHESNRAAYTAWEFDDIPVELEVTRAARRTRVFPALQDRQEYVRLELFESQKRAMRTHRRGVLRLFLLSQRKLLRRLVRGASGVDQMRLSYALVKAPPPWIKQADRPGGTVENGDQLVRDLTEIAALNSLDEVSGLEVRGQSEFRQASAAALEHLPSSLERACRLCEQILELYRVVRLDLEESPVPAKAESREDIENHLATLVYRGFIGDTPAELLDHYPRYLQALQKRIEKLRQGGARDADKVAALTPHWLRYLARRADHASRGRRDEQLDRYRWMIEEYRVSLFAQEVGTAHPVSKQRLDRQWAKVMP